jgi:WD40 repeat protein
MSAGIEQAVVRIYHANQVVGSGVLVNDRRILTCAHIISRPLGFSKPPEMMPIETVMLDFPLVQPDQKLMARIMVWDSQHDVAGLELLEALLDNIKPASLVHSSRLWGHPFKALGFPKGYDQGVWTDGEIRGPNGAGWIQIDDAKQTGYFVQPGFSGGPVWDETLNGVAGIVVQADLTPGVRSAFMIPTEVLYRLWPMFPEPSGILAPLHGVPELPEKYLPRPEDLAAVKDLILGEPGHSTAILGKSRSIGLHGMGGIGKSVLAAGVAHDYEVRRAFPDGIVWLTLGQDAYLTARQEDLARALGEKEAFKDKWQGRTRLRELLADRICLIILDDVWDYRHVVDAFDCLGVGCRLLVTTRDQSIVADLHATAFTVELLTEDQSLVLLAEWAGQSVSDLPVESSEVARECGFLPLALAMVGALVQHNPESWSKALHRLKTADLGKIRQQFPNYPYEDLLKAIQVSVDALPEGWRERYLDFAVFPEDALVPPAVPKIFWAPLGLNAYDVDDILGGLVNRSLARRDSQGRLFLHDLQRDYVRKQARDLTDLHRRLLDIYRHDCQDWAKGPKDGYLFDHLVYHLVQAREWHELSVTLCNLDFLEARCREGSVYDLENDYRLALASWEGTKQDRVLIEKFEERLRLEAGRIHQVPELLTPILYNYLTWVDAPSGPIHCSLESYRQKLVHWLRSLQDPRPQPPLWLHSLEGHTDSVNALALSPDGRQIVSGSSDKTLKVWDLESGRLIHSLEGHTDSVRTLALSTDGRHVISGSDDQTLKVWDLESGRLVRSLEGHTDSVTTLTLTSDGRQIISGTYNGVFKVWDLHSGRMIRSIEKDKDWIYPQLLTPNGLQIVSDAIDGTTETWEYKNSRIMRLLIRQLGPVRMLALTPDMHQVISISSSNTLKVWELEDGRLLRSLRGHWGHVNEVAVTPDGHTLVSGSDDNTLMVWDFDSGRLLHSMESHMGSVNAVAVTPDGHRIVSGSDDNTIKVWDLQSGRLLRSMEGHIGSVNALAVTPDRNRIVSGSDDNTIKVWDLESNQLLHSFMGHTKSINAVAITPDGRKVVSGSMDCTLKVWDLERGQLIRTLEGHLGGVYSLAITPNGSELVSGSGDKTLKIWSLDSGRLLRSLEGHSMSVNAVAVTSDGRRVVSGSGDNTVRVWNLDNGMLIHSLKGHTRSVNSMVITQDDRYVVSGSHDRTIKVWNLENGQLLRSLTGHVEWINAISVMANGYQIVSGGGDKTLKIWDIESGQLIDSFEGHTDWIKSIALIPNSHKFISGSDDKTIKVWDLQSKTQNLRSMDGHSSFVTTIAFSPHNDYVVSGSDDATIKVWDLITGQLLHSFEGHTACINTLAISPDARRVISGSDDSTLKVWDLKDGTLLHSLDDLTGEINKTIVTRDGYLVISGNVLDILKVWNLQSGELLETLDCRNLTALAVTMDGCTVISEGENKNLEAWDLDSDRILYPLFDYADSVRNSKVTPDGRLLILATRDMRLKVLDLESGQILHSIECHPSQMTDFALNSSGRKVFTASYDKTICLYDLESGATQILFRNDSPITCIALSKDDNYLAAGDLVGRVWIFEWIN